MNWQAHPEGDKGEEQPMKSNSVLASDSSLGRYMSYRAKNSQAQNPGPMLSKLAIQNQLLCLLWLLDYELW